MRAVFVNHCHPETPHVCAVRVREFAQAMARRGHQIVLLTQTLADEPASAEAPELAAALEAHDFANPYNLACAPLPHALLRTIRNENTAAAVRRPLVLYQYLAHRGVFTDWRRSAEAYYPVLADRFAPEVVWASFGNTDCWNIGQDLARRAGCPWVADVKDNWSSFIPAGLRGLAARNYSDRKSWTALSQTNRTDGAKWLGDSCRVVYSGTPNSWSPAPHTEAVDRPTLSLTGGIYNPAALADLFRGIKRWAENRPPDQPSGVHLVYAGNDTAAVERQAPALGNKVKLSCVGYLDVDTLYKLWTTSLANLYVRSESGFHHKIIEFLSAGRPIICLPAEDREALELAAGQNVPFASCHSADEVAEALNNASDQADKSGPAAKSFPYTWDKLSEALETVLHSAIDQHRVAAKGR